LVVEQPTPLKNHGVKVSWDDEIPHIWKNKSHVPVTTNQVITYFLSGMSHQVIFKPCSTSIFFHALKPPSRPPGGLTHGSSRHFPLGLESGTVAATGAFRATQDALSKIGREPLKHGSEPKLT